MRFKIVIIQICVLLTLFSADAFAYDYKAENIPDSLKEGAVAVVRNYSAIYTMHDVNNATFQVTKVITILNDKGNDYAHFYETIEDNFSDLQKFEGIIHSNSGKEIKKIKKKDLIESTFSEYLATGVTKLFYPVSSPVYPYTVEYTYEIKFKNGIMGVEPFLPIMNEKLSSQKAEYRIEVPLDTKLRIYTNFDFHKTEEIVDKYYVYTFRSEGIKPIKGEPLSPSSDEIFPMTRFGLGDFCYDKVCGDYSTWQKFGIWINKLLEGRDVLPADIIQKIKDITNDAKTDREKVAILYKYLQDNSRYVNISLGIGGFQPFPAASTIKNRFGDCKGLSYLMMAMLKVIDIPSYFTIIHTGKKKEFLRDFSDGSQANHAILQVPLPNDTIWLECTSQDLPFGYIHPNIVGHDALVMTDQGGELHRLPSYSSTENLEESTLIMNINPDGKIDGKMKFTEHVHGFGTYFSTMRSNDREDHIRYIAHKLSLSNMKIGQIKTSESLSNLPSCTLEADYTVEDAINKSGQRMFIPLLPLKKNFYSVFRANKREYDIVIADGFSESDSIVINLPEGYIVETLPKPILSLTPFGTLIVLVEKKDDNTVVYKQDVNIFTGRYKPSQYEEIKKFFNGISNASRNKIVIKKVEI